MTMDKELTQEELKKVNGGKADGKISLGFLSFTPQELLDLYNDNHDTALGFLEQCKDNKKLINDVIEEFEAAELAIPDDVKAIFGIE